MFKPDSFYSNLAQVGLAGAARGAVGLTIEHPLDTIKTVHQAHPAMSSPIKVMRMIYQQNGWRGYYAGIVPNGIRICGKQLYRWPMMLAFPSFFNNQISDTWKHSIPFLPKLLSGLSIASFETFIITPFERLKIVLMTRDRSKSKRNMFFIQNKGQILFELYRGLNITWTKQIVSWVSFLVSDDRLKAMERKRTGNENLSFMSLLKVSMLVGTINTVICIPLDVVKTNLQKENFLQNTSIKKNLLDIYQNYGVSGLYRGYQIRMIQYMLHSLFTVQLLDFLETKWKKVNNYQT